MMMDRFLGIILRLTIAQRESDKGRGVEENGGTKARVMLDRCMGKGCVNVLVLAMRNLSSLRG